MSLSAEQLVAVNFGEGVAVIVACPGSGKTAVITQRFTRLLSTGVPPSDILSLTFTAEAAAEMAKRAGAIDTKCFRTFHSFCLNLMQVERKEVPFQMCETIIPVENQNYELLFRLCKTYPQIRNFRDLQSQISLWKQTGVDSDRALDESNGNDYYVALAYGDYERISRDEGWLDFDSLQREAKLLLETNNAVRSRWQYRFVQCDEGQDCDTSQFRILQLVSEKYKNVLIVGDENQCQPSNTMVEVVKEPTRGSKKAITFSVPIENLDSEKHRLVSWDTHDKRIIGSGRSFRKSSRRYNGNLLVVRSGGKLTKMTPDHFVWAKFNKSALEESKQNYFVYLMWRRDLGFRVGTSHFRRTSGVNQVSHRGYQEKAEKMWVIRLFQSQVDAETFEEICSLKYRIPECVYHSNYEHMRKTEQHIKQVFDAADPMGGYRLLKDVGLLFYYPFCSWENTKKHYTKFHGYFKTVAANLIPGIMDLPTITPYKSAIIDEVTIEPYDGMVYSLDVERDHTYVADGIPVGNCIYEWRGAGGNTLTNFERLFPGTKKLYLSINYRSTKKLVEFFREILPVDNGLASKMESAREEGVDPIIVRYSDDHEEADAVLNDITRKNDLVNTAVITRTNRQLYIFEKRCVSRGIKYRILGKKDFFELPEVVKLLKLAKEHAAEFDGIPAAEALNSIVHQYRLLHIYKPSDDPTEATPMENLTDICKMGKKHPDIPTFLAHLRKVTHARKSSKGLTLCTAHQSKGKEFVSVYVVGANQGNMPHSKGDLAEESRIWFVACSRASDNLIISYFKNLSMFVPERLRSNNGLPLYQLEG